MVFHLVKVGVFGQKFSKMLVCAERIKIGENNIALRVPRVAYLQMLRVGIHLAVDLLFYNCRRVGKIDAVTERFAHFGLSVNAGQAALSLVFRYHSLGHYQRFAVNSVKFFDYLSRLLEHGQLILSDRYNVCVECGDVGGL